MAGDTEMSGWTELLHSSTKLPEQAAGSQFPNLHRGIDQLESLSKKLRTKVLRSEATAQSIPATRLLAREGLNAEHLARDLESFELKTTCEDVFPSKAATLEEYLQQVHQISMVSAIEEAQKDNLQSFSDHMMHVLEGDWLNEKKDFLQNLSRLSTLPRTNSSLLSSGMTRTNQTTCPASPHISTGPFPVELMPLANRSFLEKKASAYAEVVGNLNDTRGGGLPFKPATSFGNAYGSLNLETSGGKSVTMQKIWHLIRQLVGEETDTQRNISKKMLLVVGARNHLECGHEKHILDTIQSHPALAAFGGSVENLQRVRSYIRVRFKDHGALDFDAGVTCRQPPVDTTWQQIYYCLRTGYYEEARRVAQSSRVAHLFSSQLAEWIDTGGMVSMETAAAASEECDKILRIGDRAVRPGYDRKKLLLYALISGCRCQIDRLLRDMSTLFSTIEDFLWFVLSSMREHIAGSSAHVQNEGLVPYTLDDLQAYLNKFEPSYYTKNGKDPLVYPYVLLLSIQLLPAVLYLSKEVGEEGYNIDAVHISIVLADHGVLEEGAGCSNKKGLVDACAEAANIIQQYGSLYLRRGNLLFALQYYVQAAAAVSGGKVSWIGHGYADQQRQRTLMLNSLFTEIILRDGGIPLLLGHNGAGEEGMLRKYLIDSRIRKEFLLEAAHRCLEAGLYDKSIEIHKRVGAFAPALETINKCLSDAICAMSRGRIYGESCTAGLLHSGNEILGTFRYYSQASIQDGEQILEQEIVMRQLEEILHVHKLAKEGQHIDALREVAKLSFLPFNLSSVDDNTRVLQNLSPHVQACVPDLLKVSLGCMDHAADTDGTLLVLKAKITNFVAKNMNRNWPNDLYEKAAQSI